MALDRDDPLATAYRSCDTGTQGSVCIGHMRPCVACVFDAHALTQVTEVIDAPVVVTV